MRPSEHRDLQRLAIASLSIDAYSLSILCLGQSAHGTSEGTSRSSNAAKEETAMALPGSSGRYFAACIWSLVTPASSNTAASPPRAL